jgi:glutathione S-transferase
VTHQAGLEAMRLTGYTIASSPDLCRETIIMKLLSGPTSPFARKCRIVAIEKSVTLEEIGTNPFESTELPGINPLKMIPVLILDDGTTMYDSDVICRYLDQAGEGPSLFPKADRWAWMTRATLGHGLADASVALQLQKVLPESDQSAPLMDKMRARMARITAGLEADFAGLEAAPMRMDVICAVMGLGHVELRHGDTWRADHPMLAAWYLGQLEHPSFKATIPVG